MIHSVSVCPLLADLYLNVSKYVLELRFMPKPCIPPGYEKKLHEGGSGNIWKTGT